MKKGVIDPKEKSNPNLSKSIPSCFHPPGKKTIEMQIGGVPGRITPYACKYHDIIRGINEDMRPNN